MIGIKQEATIKLLASLGSQPSLPSLPHVSSRAAAAAAALSPPQPLADVESTDHVLPSSTPITYVATSVGHQVLSEKLK